MSVRPMITRAFAGVVACSVLGLMACSTASDPDPKVVLFPYEYDTVLARGFQEPSGIVWHPLRGTLFVVGDEGDIAEYSVDGTQLAIRRIEREQMGARPDFEGITVIPETGLLYVAVEGAEQILEVSPDDLTILRRFAVAREHEGRTIMAAGGQGFESITFVPRIDDPDGGTFFVANQGFENAPDDDRSVIIEVRLPRRANVSESDDHVVSVPILRVLEPGITDLSGMHYDADRNLLLVLSDSRNALSEIRLDGTIAAVYAIQGRDQEGITIDGDGNVYIAQDSGLILKLRPSVSE